MDTVPNTEDTIPAPEAFASWVRRSLADLRMRPSHFLTGDGRPTGKNRVSRFLDKPSAVKLEFARTLEREIREAARKKEVELLPLPTVLVECQVTEKAVSK